MEKSLLAFAIIVLIGFVQQARADYEQRISLGVGIAQFKNSSETDLEVGAEYEYRLDPLLGIGGFGSYIFSDPGVTFLGAPSVYFHPFATDFLVSASPVVEFGSGIGTNVGVRFGTRIPIPLGVVTLVPTFAVDVISGGPDFIYGIGIQI
jgi:hypothetical protein